MFSGFYNADKDRSPASLILSIMAPLEDRKPAQHFFFQKKVQEILSSGGTDHQTRQLTITWTSDSN
jgi:hypothetical protein